MVTLVHETYLRITRGGALQPGDRRRFYAYAATIMRSIIVDEARRRSAARRGGDQVQVTLVTSLEAQSEETVDVEALDGAMRELQQIDERCHQIVELRYFAGLSVEQVAELLELSPATIKREWQKARAFLFRALHNG